MNLLEVYKKKNENKEWFTDHASLSKGKAGRMFEYTNTNFRTQRSFLKHFMRFLEIENKPREEWLKQKDHGQEIDKQRVVNMIQSKLFKKDANQLYSRTSKGFLYDAFIKTDMGNQERWFINYVFLLNGYYFNRKNYILYRVKEDLLDYLLSTDGITEDLLIEEAKNLLSLDSLEKISRSNFFYFHSFYNDSDFLANYLRASPAEKEELANYIQKNLRTKKFDCCVSEKYQPRGNFNKNMLFDETRVFLLTLLFIQTKTVNLSNIYEVFIDNFQDSISILNKKIVLDYLHEHKDIFDSIFIDVLELEEKEMAVPEDTSIDQIQIAEIDQRDRPEDYIDETSEAGRLKIKGICAVLKRQARVLSDHTCALERINNCRPIYFTAKISGKNYLELHHLIPREFRNDFSYSIEVLANYITLCPRCHRQIHLAVDRERKHLINALYVERKDRLSIVGLESDLNKIYEYYKIDP